eukprot:6438020-Alexandrium_andersonii.AAC.1
MCIRDRPGPSPTRLSTVIWGVVVRPPCPTSTIGGRCRLGGIALRGLARRKTQGLLHWAKPVARHPRAVVWRVARRGAAAQLRSARAMT